MNNWNALVVAFVVTAAMSDVYARKIPRVLTITGTLAGLLFHFTRGDIKSSFIALLVGFGVGLVFFWLGAIAGGDVKLITALGAILGLSKWFLAMEAAVFVAAAIGLLQVVRSGAFLQTISNMQEIATGFMRSGVKPHPVIHASNPRAIRSPFGVAAAVGTIFALVLR